MLCNKDYKNLKKNKKKNRKNWLKRNWNKISVFVHKVQSCFETFCMSDFSRFLNSVNLYHNYVQLQQKNGIIVSMSGFNFIKKVKLHQHAHWAVLLIYFDCLGSGEWHLTNTLVSLVNSRYFYRFVDTYALQIIRWICQQ